MELFLRECQIQMRRPVMLSDTDRPLWLCSFTRPGTERILEVHTSPSSDHDRKPTAREAFQVAVNNAAEVDGVSSFQEWAVTCRAGDVSANSERIFRLRRHTRCQLKGFLGVELFKSAMLRAWE